MEIIEISADGDGPAERLKGGRGSELRWRRLGEQQLRVLALTDAT